jgi:GNAT superfamily N-acetyltransferase
MMTLTKPWALPRLRTTATSTTVIRRRRDKDLGACARLLRLVHDESRYPYYWPTAPRAWLDGQEVLAAWVADRLGEVLGHVAVARTTGTSAYRWREITGHEPAELALVTRLFVRQRVRGEGVGTTLLQLALEEIRNRRLLPVLEVVGVNGPAVRLVEDAGWTLLAADPWGEKGDRLTIRRYAGPREPRA